MNFKKINFVHLRFFSEYSFKEGLIKLKKIIKKMKKDNQSSIAITDDNLFGLIDFYKLCIKNNIKPIIGCNFYIKNKLNDEKPFKIIILIKNKLGYENLIKLINKSNLIKNENNRFEMDKNWFKNSLNKGLIFLSGSKDGDIGQALIHKKWNLSFKRAFFWIKYLKKNFYIEIQSLKKNYYNSKLIKLSKILNIPLVGTHNIYFLNKKDFILYKIKNCILNRNSINKLDKKILKFKKFFFYNKKKIIKLFKNNKCLLTNSFEISKKCNLFFKLDKIELPIFLNKLNNNKFLINISIKKLNNKIRKIKILKNKYKIYKSRILNECYISIKIGIVDYFLIVNDFIKWSRLNKIPKGPGRGSSAGSLISYVLKITDLDPIENNLIFERFLNIKRISMPDFDIDFCPIKRKYVINYIKLKYGIYSVCQIATLGKMSIKASIKDIGRVLGFNYIFINKLSQLISFYDNNIKIKDVLKKNYELNWRYKDEKDVKKIINLVKKFDGNIKNLGVHSGGLIISMDKIFNSFPLFLQNNILISQFSKNNIEEIGFLKFDFLGLKTLSMIHDCVSYINKNYFKFSLSKINLNDRICFNNLKLGKTIGIFQLESKGMQIMFKKAKPDSFKNIIALISLYRPGPIKLLDSFCLRKLGKENINYYHKKLKNILEETYGIILYQEQIIFIVQIIANFSLENSDILRIAISKKNHSEMLKQKINFIKNGLNNGFSNIFLEDIFNKIEKFSGYGFNKSHAAAYSLLSYYTVWIKTYYFKEFIVYDLSQSFNNIKKIKLLFNECLENNTFILPVNINKSLYNFSIKLSKINKIRYGFNSIKGVGKNASEELINCRKKKPFKNFTNFYKRVDKNIINSKIIEILIGSGAFDSLNNNRSDLLREYKNFLIGAKIKKNIININLNNNYFWKFKIKILEENFRLGFFFLNNLINIYKNKISNIFKKKYKNLFYGIIIEIIKKINFKENFFILVLENKFIYKFKINLFLYNKNKNFIKIFNFIIIEFYYKNGFSEINRIYNMKFLKF